MTHNIADFSRAGLNLLFEHYRARGYSFETFASGPPSKNGQIYLRHDVDISLSSAASISRLEAQHDVRATFFVLTTCDTYNVHSSRSTQLLREIVDNGHQVGLHLDPTAHLEFETRAADVLEAEAKTLSDLSGTTVTHYSFHKPGPLGITRSIDSRLESTYDQIWSKEISYSSDSMGWWRYGDFRRTQEFDHRKSVQLVLHPIWWDQEFANPPWTTLMNHEVAAHAEYRTALADTVGPFATYLQPDHSDQQSWPDIEVVRPVTDHVRHSTHIARADDRPTATGTDKA